MGVIPVVVELEDTEGTWKELLSDVDEADCDVEEESGKSILDCLGTGS